MPCHNSRNFNTIAEASFLLSITHCFQSSSHNSPRESALCRPQSQVRHHSSSLGSSLKANHVHVHHHKLARCHNLDCMLSHHSHQHYRQYRSDDLPCHHCGCGGCRLSGRDRACQQGRIRLREERSRRLRHCRPSLKRCEGHDRQVGCHCDGNT